MLPVAVVFAVLAVVQSASVKYWMENVPAVRTATVSVTGVATVGVSIVGAVVSTDSPDQSALAIAALVAVLMAAAAPVIVVAIDVAAVASATSTRKLVVTVLFAVLSRRARVVAIENPTITNLLAATERAETKPAFFAARYVDEAIRSAAVTLAGRTSTAS